MERLRNLGVDVDQLVVLDEDALVALVDLLADPVGEDGPEQRVADVGDPLLGQLADLLVDGQVVGDDIVRSHVGRDLVDGERLVLRDGNPLHVLALDALLPACHQVLQEVDGHLLWQNRNLDVRILDELRLMASRTYRTLGGRRRHLPRGS